jgi:hypothetical protein
VRRAPFLMISFTKNIFKSTFFVLARRSVRKVLDRLINSEFHESRGRLERDYSTFTSTDLIISKKSEEKKMSVTMDPQDSKDGHQEAFEDSSSKEKEYVVLEPAVQPGPSYSIPTTSVVAASSLFMMLAAERLIKMTTGFVPPATRSQKERVMPLLLQQR